jgi:hypothetical protein
MPNPINLQQEVSVEPMKEIIGENFRVGVDHYNTRNGGRHAAIMIHGAPGGGKSDGSIQVAEELALEYTGQPLLMNPTLMDFLTGKVAGRFFYKDVRLNLLSPIDLRGLPHVRDVERPNGDKQAFTMWAQPEFIPPSDCGAWGGILNLEELPTSDPEVQSPAYQLVLEGRVGDHVLPANTMVIATGNRAKDAGVFNKMGRALGNRFTHLRFSPNINEWTGYAIQAGIDHKIVDFLNFQPDLLQQETAGHNDEAWASPRTWFLANRHLKMKSPQARRIALIGAVGDYAANELFAFMELYGQLPDVDKILAAKEKTVPNKRNLCFALTGALVQKVTEATAKAFIDYISNFPDEEMTLLAIRYCLKQDRKFIVNVPGFKPWLVKHRDVLL